MIIDNKEIELNTDILKNEWEYDGLVISDWGAVHSTVESALAGMDLEMGVTYNFDEYYFAKSLKEAVEKGQVPEEVLDDKVARILRLQKKIKIYDGVRNKGSYNTIAHHEAILNADDANVWRNLQFVERGDGTEFYKKDINLNYTSTINISNTNDKSVEDDFMKILNYHKEEIYQMLANVVNRNNAKSYI